MKRLLIILSIPAILLLWFGQHRYFYRFNNGKKITVWKTFGGTCYIIPRTYLWPFRPATNFISTSNLDDINILCDSGSGYDFIVENQLTNKITVKMPDYKVRYYSSIQYPEFAETYPVNSPEHKNIEYLSIDLAEMLAVLNGQKQ